MAGASRSRGRYARRCATAVAGVLAPEQVDVERFDAYLPTSKLPPLDLLIRTSGEQRISNFMLWEIAYAELLFVDVLWPEFRREHLYDVPRPVRRARAPVRADVGSARL